VLTGVVPYGNSKDVERDIWHGKRPPRPTDPSQNQLLQDRVWDMITTCWGKEPEKRCELVIVHHVFSTPSPQDLLSEFPPAGRENLIRLAEELLYMFLVLPLDSSQRTTLGRVQEYISNVMSKDEASPAILSSIDATSLAETFRKVSFPSSIFLRFLKPLAVRTHLTCRHCYHVPRFVYGSGFTHTPSFSTRKCSRAWNFLMNPQTIRPLEPRIFGRGITVERRCA
jgi:hypothetical protein